MRIQSCGAGGANPARKASRWIMATSLETVIRRELIAKGCRPLAHLQAVAQEPYPVLLESSLHSGGLGQYSILCWDPFKKLVVREEGVEIHDLAAGRHRVERGNPFSLMSDEFARHRVRAERDFDLPFAGGAIGYFSYDLRHRVERLPRQCDYDIDIPYVTLCFYDHALIFDHERNLTEWVALPGCTVQPPSPVGEVPQEPVEIPEVVLESDFAPGEYIRAVERAKEYIAAGDIFQVNLSQRFAGKCEADGLQVYQRLRALNPAPFSAYIKYPGFEIISSSPERFLLVKGDVVTTRPIKGTRPRREGDEAFNRAMRRQLQASEKDHAELTMIVDLERNDLGRVCKYGTVTVAEHAVLETYATVYHLVSTVQGQLYRPGQDEFSLIRAAFPGGSITGAPKIRAMEIIEELEPHARAVYTGAIGYLSFHGRMDLNIVIRTMLKKGEHVYMNLGGGIVADSVPELEYEETLHKGKALFQALNAQTYERLMGSAAHEA